MSERPAGGAPSWYRSAAVTQVDYDDAWPARYETEARIVSDAIGPDLVTIEHVGSTAVPDLSAKPIIDLLAAVSSWGRFDEIVATLARADYLYTPHSERDDPGRRVFRKPSDMSQSRTHHLHVTEVDSDYWIRIVAFRDHLRSHDDDAIAYSELKRRLAVEFMNDSESYTRGKADFVKAIERKADARDERGQPR